MGTEFTRWGRLGLAGPRRAWPPNSVPPFQSIPTRLSGLMEPGKVAGAGSRRILLCTRS